MDNLKLQTVYVPVEGELDARPALCFWGDNDESYGWQYQTDLQKLNNRIVLTVPELSVIIANAMNEALKTKPATATVWNEMYSDFIKSKGIEL